MLFQVMPPGGLEFFRGTVVHEAVGHGFGLLADEYEYVYNWPGEEISDSKKSRLQLDQAQGLHLNVSLTNDPHSVYWSHLIGHPRYPYVGIYEGGYVCSYGVWRSEYQSIMRESMSYLYFNAICRELLVKRILDLSGEEYSFEKFLETDSDEGRPGRGTSALGLRGASEPDWVHHPPVRLDEP